MSCEFKPRALANWFQERISDWAERTGSAHASPHVFRKTALQHARSGEDVNERVAQDAKLSASVMVGHYITEGDEELRQASNRTYQRIAASLPADVARRYGHVPPHSDPLNDKLRDAVEAQDWSLVRKISAELANRDQSQQRC